jgi:hypothetical protein
MIEPLLRRLGAIFASTRRGRKPFAIRADAEPQRLLALVALRRQIIERVLGLTGPEADAAAFALEPILRARLAAERDLAQKHLLALGLLTLGQRDTLDLLFDTLIDAPPAITVQAFALLLPLPRRLRNAIDPAALIDWFRRHYRRLKWDADHERFTL